jgi:type I restriction enzyme M protein
VPAEPNTKDLWIYDLRTNQRFTLKERPMARADLDDFVACYKSGSRHQRAESERFRRFAYADLAARDKVNLDIVWLKDDTLDDPDLLAPPDEIAAEIVENLEARSTASVKSPSACSLAERRSAKDVFCWEILYDVILSIKW